MLWLYKEKEQLTKSNFESFQSKLINFKNKIHDKIDMLLEKNISLYIYGAGHKASTIINFLGLTDNEIAMCIDNDPNKHNKVVPIAGIPIRPIENLLVEAKKKRIGVMVLAIDHLLEVEIFLKKELEKGSYIIHLLPSLRLITAE